MMFLSHAEIDTACERHAKHPVLKRATRILRDLRDLANDCSDGWHSWPAPARAARQLMELVKINPEKHATEANLRKALAPIKSLLTRRAKDFAGKTINFD